MNNVVRTIRSILLLIALGSVFTLTACAKEDDETRQPNTENQGQEHNPEDMTQVEQEIVAFLDRWQRAMTDKDVATLGSLMADDVVLVHITGQTQTKQEWLDEIAAETMRYYDIERENLTIEVDGDHAIARYVSVIDARIWGTRGTWRLNTTMYTAKMADGWIRVNPPQSDNN